MNVYSLRRLVLRLVSFRAVVSIRLSFLFLRVFKLDLTVLSDLVDSSLNALNWYSFNLRAILF